MSTCGRAYRIFSRHCLWIGAALVLAGPVFARDVRVAVVDADLDIPLEGAVIRTPDGRDWESGPDGSVVVTVPDDVRLVLRAVYPGYEAGRAVLAGDALELKIALSLSGAVESRELVVEAARPRASETVPGRSVAMSGGELARSAEIGAIEDVMNAVKLLPGVGYAGMFNSMPSVRGGDPGDLIAVFDGFYVENPYHFGGGVSIFDPRMIESAQLSHGVFSARYGHTISGILDIKSKKGDSSLSFLELGASSSAANMNLSHPINGAGSFSAMLKATYWAPVIWAAQGLSAYIDDEELDAVNAITLAPYILSGTVSADYRFTPDFSASFNAFLGGDGGGVVYENPSNAEGYEGYTDIGAEWLNSVGFLTGGLLWNPRPDMAVGLRLGAGFSRTDMDARIVNSITAPYTQEFINDFDGQTLLYPPGTLISLGERYTVDNRQTMFFGDETDTVQARLDVDWDLKNGFFVAGGIQEQYSRWLREEDMWFTMETPGGILTTSSGGQKTLYYNYPVNTSISADNHAFSTSGYLTGEWTSPSGFFDTELGIRLDSFTFLGKDFSVKSSPAFNPRLNMNFHVIRNRDFVDSLTLTLGTGLFSSMTDSLSDMQKDEVDDYELKPNRSWTSIAGAHFNFLGAWTLNIEAYYKQVFSRGYRINWVDDSAANTSPRYYFDGEGTVWGADVMLHKRAGRFVDGWITYTFTYARYAEPGYASSTESTYRADGYYPSFHRFHNLNLILNIKPQDQFHIYIRYGFASGQPKSAVGAIDYYPVAILDENHQPGQIIQKYKRNSYYSDDLRTTPSMPFDIKCSWFFFNQRGRTTGEFYIALENIASLFYNSRANTSFNQYTGKEDTGSTQAIYELPIPVPSMGYKWSF